MYGNDMKNQLKHKGRLSGLMLALLLAIFLALFLAGAMLQEPAIDERNGEGRAVATIAGQAFSL